MESTASPGNNPLTSKSAVLGDAVRQSLAYSVTVVVRRLGAVLLMPVYTRYLTKADYGVMDLLDTTIYLVTILVGMRRADSLLYFYSLAADDQERNRILSTSVLGSYLLGLAVALMGIAFSPAVARLALGGEQFASYATLAFGTLFFVMPVESGLAFLRQQGRAALCSGLSTASLLLAIVLNVILLVGFGMRVEAFLWSNLITSAALSVYLTCYCLRRSGFHFHLRSFWNDIRYGAPLAVHGIGMLLIHRGDRFFLASSAPLGEIGLYALAYKIGMLVSYLHTPFDQYWRAQVFTILKRPDGEHLYVRAYTYLALAMTSGMVALVVFLRPVLRVMAGAEFAGAAAYIPLLLLAYVIRSLGDQMRTCLRVEGQTWQEAKITGLATVFCLIAYAALIPPFGVWGAVWATVLTFLAMLVLSVWISQKVRRFGFELGRLLKLAAAAGAAVAVSYLWSPETLALQLAAGVLCLCLYGGILLLLGVFEADERRLAAQQWAGLRQRLFPSSRRVSEQP